MVVQRRDAAAVRGPGGQRVQPDPAGRAARGDATGDRWRAADGNRRGHGDRRPGELCGKPGCGLRPRGAMNFGMGLDNARSGVGAAWDGTPKGTLGGSVISAIPGVSPDTAEAIYGQANLAVGAVAMAFGSIDASLTVTSRLEKPEYTPQNFTAKFGIAENSDYRSTFFAEYPQFRGDVVVHHAVERQVLTRYPNLIDEMEIHSIDNLRGIPKEANSELHLSEIRREWNRFYRENINPTRQDILDKATEIDNKYGYRFKPPIR